MDWLSALCLSVPPSLALYAGIRAALHKWDVLSTTRNVATGANVDIVAKTIGAAVVRIAEESQKRASELSGLAATVIDETVHAAHAEGKRNRERARAAEKHARKTALLVAEIEAEAAVKCARYGAKVIRGKPPKEPARKPTAHEVWLGTEGKALPESVRDRVEWAVGRLRGVESDEQGDEEDAEAILEQFAPGLAGATRDEVLRELGAKS